MADETANALSDIVKVKTWTAAKKLSEATTAAVISLWFNSMEAVSLISPEYLAKSNIPVGQIKMLIKAVKQTFLSEDGTMAVDALQSGHAQPNQDDATRTSGNTVNNAIHTGWSEATWRSTSFIRENFTWQELQIYIKSLANTQDNYHDIVDFVSASGTSFNDDTLLSYSSTGHLFLKLVLLSLRLNYNFFMSMILWLVWPFCIKC